MNAPAGAHRIRRWMCEFRIRGWNGISKSCSARCHPAIAWALIVWVALLLLFAVPDYIAMGPVRPFYYLLAYRIVIVVALVVLIFSITPDTRVFQISYSVAVVVVAGFTGFMLFFIYRPDVVTLIIIVIMVQLISLLIFVPIRFMVAVFLRSVRRLHHLGYPLRAGNIAGRSGRFVHSAHPSGRHRAGTIMRLVPCNICSFV
jgi:hypothetical protein